MENKAEIVKENCPNKAKYFLTWDDQERKLCAVHSKGLIAWAVLTKVQLKKVKFPKKTEPCGAINDLKIYKMVERKLKGQRVSNA